MSKLFESDWAAVKKALLEADPIELASRKTIVWHEENTRRYSMSATVYSKPNCPFCVRAKKLLDEKGIGYTEVSAVDKREELIERVTAVTGTAPKSVPQIWLGETYIGGFTELDAHFKKQA